MRTNCYDVTNRVEIVASKLIVPKYTTHITYLVSVTFLLKGSNLTTIFFTGFKFSNRTCFAIALATPADLFKVPENLMDILRTFELPTVHIKISLYHNCQHLRFPSFWGTNQSFFSEICYLMLVGKVCLFSRNIPIF
jgi:hypothetical protein